MALTCSRCSRVNPADAQYCYFDGVVLQGQGNQGPLNMATLPFPMPFVFPSGRACQNFDQLTLACHEESKAAMEALAQGDLASFLGGIGRSDLARVARDVAKAPDLNRALDDLLAKFPSSILQPPKLVVQPSEINLGELKLGEDRDFNLQLSNQGMRLVYGTINCKEVYLSLGEAGGAQQKLFEFKTDLTVPVHIRGKRLVARPKPYEAKIVIDSSGGPAEVTLRFNISVRPFPQGVLSGAVSPRQIAEKAKAHPKDAAPFFENGSVARWYKENGWDYPVKGAVTSGLAAIQQFFEAHGLARAPKVGINQNQIVLMGAPGETIRHQLEVRTQEKRSVYALASSNQPWVAIESTPPRGQVAAVNLLVTVPDSPGETLQAKVMIRANGNQQFAVPVSLQVGGSRRAGMAAAAAASGGLDRNLLAGLADAAVSSRPYAPSSPIALQPLATPAAVAPRSRPPRSRDGDDEPEPEFIPRRKKRGNPIRHLLPALLLLLPVAGFFTHDMLVHAPGKNVDVELPPDPEEKLDLSPWVALRMQDSGHPYPPEVDPQRRLGGTMRFGLIMAKVADPTDPAKYKRLTYMERGLTNNTVIRVDNNDCIFGQLPGHWLEPRVALPKDTKENRDPDGAKSVWTAENASLASGKIVVTQVVEVVRGQTNVLDTCLIRYQIENKDTVAHKVGIRFMLDTFIGAEDGVPFAIPGKKGLCDTMDEFNDAASVPDFIQAYEHNDLNNPGTIALVQFRVGGGLESPARVTLGAWPDPKIGEARFPGKKDNPYQQFMTGWNVPLDSMQTMRQINPKATADSCVVMYWPEQELKAGEKRVIGFSYGLGALGTQKEGKLGLSFGGSTELGGEFSITALITNPAPGQNVSLQLPQGLTLVEGDANQVVPAVPENSARPVSTVTWKVKASKEGVHTIGIESGTLKASLKVRIRKPEQRGVFD
jgi:hypothetical protein